MQRHDTDWISLFAGAICLAVSAGYLLTHTTNLRVHWLVVVPVALVLLGAATLVAAVRRISESPYSPNAVNPEGSLDVD